MRKFLLTFIVAVSLLSLYLYLSNSSTPKNEKGLNWGHDYHKALEIAKKENKLVYLFIGADKCVHCDRFKKETLSNKELIEEMKKEYVLLYMSRDQHKIPSGFKTQGVPMHYFLNPKGEIIAHMVGSKELAGWYEVLDEVDLLNGE